MLIWGKQSAQDRFVVMQVFEYIYIHIFIHARRFLPDLTFFQNGGTFSYGFWFMDMFPSCNKSSSVAFNSASWWALNSMDDMP